MEYKEYEVLVNGIIEHPDKAPIAIAGLLGEIKKDLDCLSSARVELGERDKRIRDLQDTNTKLFLAQTSSAEKDDEPDDGWQQKSGTEALEAYIAEKKAKGE